MAPTQSEPVRRSRWTTHAPRCHDARSGARCRCTLDVAGGVATITLDSPANRNALSAAVRAGLTAALDSATDGSGGPGHRAHPPRAGVLLGHGPQGGGGRRPGPAGGARTAGDPAPDLPLPEAGGGPGRRTGPGRRHRPAGRRRHRGGRADRDLRLHRGADRVDPGRHHRPGPAPGRAAAAAGNCCSPARSSGPTAPWRSGWSTRSTTTSTPVSPATSVSLLAGGPTALAGNEGAAAGRAGRLRGAVRAVAGDFGGTVRLRGGAGGRPVVRREAAGELGRRTQRLTATTTATIISATSAIVIQRRVSTGSGRRLTIGRRRVALRALVAPRCRGPRRPGRAGRARPAPPRPPGR